MRLLKRGGYAPLLLLYEGASFVFPKLDVNAFNVIRSIHVVHPTGNGEKQFTIMLYVVHNSIGIIIKHCDTPGPFQWPQFGVWPSRLTYNASQTVSWMNAKTMLKFEVTLVTCRSYAFLFLF